MSNLKNILDACDVFISGEFVGFSVLDFYPTGGLRVLVIKKTHFGCAENYSILIPAADWEYVNDLGLSAGDEIFVPVCVDFSFDIRQPIIWLSDRHEVAKNSLPYSYSV
ncbi:hypothetical protein ABRQ07_02000 [Pectobacterium polonicum]|uniref:Uncharacterized protein n=1 Tax=Pectobacterium polonicum TaxID=2485124 RepID=A0ABV1P5F7_9GAMM|nr:hypothetical protein [Pectobacterium polonicum]MDC9817849.1 hypothetical protein [Pectobacterium polonicum]